MSLIRIPTLYIVVIGLALLSANVCLAQANKSTEETADSQKVQSVKPGINANFLNKDLDVSEWIGRFEVESREVYAHRTKVLDATGIKSGDTVADIGAGTGFYSRLFAEVVGAKGHVYAVDISPNFIEHIQKQVRTSKIANISTVLCSEKSAELKPDSVDVVFICDTYHHFEYPQATLKSIRYALRPGGTLVVIDFERIPGESREYILGHVRAGKAVFQKEIEDAGFKFVKEVVIPGLKENYFLKFERPQS